jgi:hypothetical protein
VAAGTRWRRTWARPCRRPWPLQRMGKCFTCAPPSTLPRTRRCAARPVPPLPPNLAGSGFMPLGPDSFQRGPDSCQSINQSIILVAILVAAVCGPRAAGSTCASRSLRRSRLRAGFRRPRSLSISPRPRVPPRRWVWACRSTKGEQLTYPPCSHKPSPAITLTPHEQSTHTRTQTVLAPPRASLTRTSSARGCHAHVALAAFTRTARTRACVPFPARRLLSAPWPHPLHALCSPSHCPRVVRPGAVQEAAALAQRFVDLLTANGALFKPCVSFGQDNGLVYATVPATSTQVPPPAPSRCRRRSRWLRRHALLPQPPVTCRLPVGKAPTPTCHPCVCPTKPMCLFRRASLHCTSTIAALVCAPGGGARARPLPSCV